MNMRPVCVPVIFSLLAFYVRFNSAVEILLPDPKGGVSENASTFYQKYLNIDKQLKSFISKQIKYAIPMFMEASEHINVSSKCVRNVLTLVTGIRNLKFSALSFLDATGKLSDGLFSDNINMFGDFDQCLGTTVHKRNGDLDFRGQYCILTVIPLLTSTKKVLTLGEVLEDFVNVTRNASELMRHYARKAPLMLMMPMKLGLCVPSGCSQQEINQALRYFGKKILVNATTHSCQVEGMIPENVKLRQIIIIGVCCTLGLLGVLGSFVEHFSCGRDGKSKNPFTKILLCFSITSNFQKIMNTKTTETTLSCLHGIRALSLFYVILSHQFLFLAVFNSTRHIGRVATWIQEFFPQIILNGFMTVDVFFLMGGIVNSYIKVKNASEKSTHRSPGYLKMIFFRIWRLYPGLIFCLMMAFSFTARGPLALITKSVFVDTCEKYWWTNMLFINNFVDKYKMCAEQTWYICVDFQLFLLSLYTVDLLISKPKIGIVTNAAMVAIGLIITVVWGRIINAPPVVLFSKVSEEIIDAFTRMFFLPTSHMAPYFTGILLGYFLAKTKNIEIPKIIQVIGWPIAGICLTSMTFVSQKWNSGAEYTPMEAAMYFAFARFIYPLSAAWMILCCATGYGGIINYILCLKMWVPISKLSYVVYLLSPIIQLFYMTNQRTGSDMQDMLLIWQHFGDLVVCCLFGLAAALLMDSPALALQKLLLQPKTKDSGTEEQPKGDNKNGAIKEQIEIRNVN